MPKSCYNAPMRFDVFTLFPGIFESPLKESMLKRAIESGLLEVQLHNIRDYAAGSASGHRRLSLRRRRRHGDEAGAGVCGGGESY